MKPIRGIYEVIHEIYVGSMKSTRWTYKGLHQISMGIHEIDEGIHEIYKGNL